MWFAIASPWVAKIAAYKLANELAATSQATADLTDADALHAALPTDVVAAYEALQADPTNTTLQDAYNAAVTGASLDPAAFETAYGEWQSAVEADNLAAEAEAAAVDALNAAANKLPVDEETKAALDQLLAGK